MKGIKVVESRSEVLKCEYCDFPKYRYTIYSTIGNVVHEGEFPVTREQIYKHILERHPEKIFERLEELESRLALLEKHTVKTPNYERKFYPA